MKMNKGYTYYEKKKAYTTYNIGNGQALSTLDKMKWGRYPQNTTHTLGYFFWKIENESCMPTLTGMKLPKKTFINSDFNRELGGDFLPILDLKFQVPIVVKKCFRV